MKFTLLLLMVFTLISINMAFSATWIFESTPKPSLSSELIEELKYDGLIDRFLVKELSRGECEFTYLYDSTPVSIVHKCAINDQIFAKGNFVREGQLCQQRTSGQQDEVQIQFSTRQLPEGQYHQLFNVVRSERVSWNREYTLEYVSEDQREASFMNDSLNITLKRSTRDDRNDFSCEEYLNENE